MTSVPTLPPPSRIDVPDQRLFVFSDLPAAGTVILGLIALAGWSLDLPALQALHPDWAPITPGDAAAFALGGVCLWMVRQDHHDVSRLGVALASLLALLGLVRFGAGLSGHGDAVESWIAGTQYVPGAAGHRSLSNGAIFALAGLSMLALPRPKGIWFNPSSVLGAIVAALGLVGLVAWCALPAELSPGVSCGNAVTTVLFGAALMITRRGAVPARAAGSTGATRIIGPGLTAVTALLPPLLYAVQVPWVTPGENNQFDHVAFTTFVYAIVLAGVMLLSLRKLEQLDAAKAATEEERDHLLERLQQQASILQQQASVLQQEVANRTTALKQLNDRHQLGLRAAHFGVWDWDLTRDCVVWDEHMLLLYGLSGNFAGRFDDWIECIFPADRARVRAAATELVAQGGHGNLKFRITRPDGTVRHLESHSIVHRDAGGRAVRVVGVHRDITAEHDHAAELRGLNQRLQFALVSAGYGVWSYNIDSQRFRWDERVLRILGADDGRANPAQTDGFSHIVADDQQRVRELFRQFATGKTGVYDTEYRIRRGTDDAVRHVHVRGYLQRTDDGQPFRIVGLIRDVTMEREREDELGTLNERLQFVVRAAGYGVWEIDLATGRATWDEREKKIFGLPADFAGDLAEQWRRLIHPEDLAGVEAEYADVVAGRRPGYQPDYRIVRPDGSIRHLATRSYVVRNAAGAPVRIVGLTHDVTADRELSERLRITEERWRLALTSNNDGVWDWDVTHDRYFRDQRFADMLGLRMADLPANLKDFARLVHPEDFVILEAALQSHLKGNTPFYQCEFRMRHADGRWIWMLDRGKVVARDSQQQPVRMVGTQTDITTRKTLEERLRHNEELSLQLSRLAQIGAWELDLATNQVTWAPEIYRIHEVDLGYVPTPESALSFYAPEARRAVEEALRRGREDGTPFDLELPFTTARGHRLWVRTLGRAEMSQGRVLRLYGAFQDITARRDAEEMRRQLESQLFQAQKMETLGTLAGGIAHDFNNLLTGILGYQDLALDTLDEDHDSRAYLSASREASMRARELVDQILTFSRQAGSEKVPVNLRLLVEDARRFLRATVPATVAIEVEFPEECPPVLADATQIHQVLLNLGSNAAFAMRSTGGVMRIRLSPHSPTEQDPTTGSGTQLPLGRYLRLDFSDTGHGMSEETQKRIFDPFFTTKEVGQGTGLGLSVVHGILQAHQGAITVESKAGKGTTFSLFLPVADASEAEAAMTDTSFPRGNGELVAIVDDEDIVRSFAQMALEKAGYRVAAFDQPAQCLEALRKSPTDFAVLLTDQTMPGMKGVELAAEVRNFAPALPVVIMSGYFSRISPDMLARIGHVSLLSKPFTNDELARAIHRSAQHEPPKAVP